MLEEDEPPCEWDIVDEVEGRSSEENSEGEEEEVLWERSRNQALSAVIYYLVKSRG